MSPDPISPELKTVLKRLRLGRMLDTLPERLVLARQQKLPHPDFLLLVLSDEVSRREGQATLTRAQRARLDPALQLEAWDPTAKVSYDQALWNELVSLRFLDAHAHVAIVGPVGVGKTFLAHALGWLACRHGHTVLATTADKMLKSLKHRASITPTSRRPANSSPSTRSSLTTSASTPSTDQESRHLRDPHRAAPRGVHRRHLESGP